MGERRNTTLLKMIVTGQIKQGGSKKKEKWKQGQRWEVEILKERIEGECTDTKKKWRKAKLLYRECENVNHSCPIHRTFALPWLKAPFNSTLYSVGYNKST